MFELDKYSGEVTAREIVKETKCYVWYVRKYFREERMTQVAKDNFYDTFEDAKAKLIEHRERQLRYNMDQVERSEVRLKKARDLSPKDGAEK